MLTVIVIMGVVMGSLTTVFVQASNAESDMNNRFQAQLTARLALDKMRREVHCASVATPAGSALVGDPHAAVVLQDRQRLDHLVHRGTVSTNRYALYRVVGATCTGGVMWADYLTPSSTATTCSGALCIFTYTAQSPTSLATLQVDLPVNVKPVEDRRAVRADRTTSCSATARAPREILVRGTTGGGASAPILRSCGVGFACVWLKSERGIALVMAIGITTVLAIAGTTAIAYSTSSATQPLRPASRQSAFTLAEAGINNVMAVLNLPTNNALDPDTLPCTTRQEVHRSDATSHSTCDGAPTTTAGRRLVRDARSRRRTLVRHVDRRTRATPQRAAPAT